MLYPSFRNASVEVVEKEFKEDVIGQQAKFEDFYSDRKGLLSFQVISINRPNKYYVGSKQKILVFLSWSASYNDYFKVRFKKDNMTITAIDSKN